MVWEWDLSDERGVSDIVGVAILISLSIVGSLAIVAIGGIALNTLTEQAQNDLADDSIRNVDARLSALADSSVDATTEFTIPEGTGDQIEANASAGRVYVSATTNATYANQTVEYADTGDSSCTVQQGLGTIVHERDNGNAIVYQGGGLWKQTPAGTQVESEPKFDYDGSAIRFGFINITGLRSVSEGETLTAEKLARESETATAEMTRELEDCWQMDGASGTVPVSINVTISSEYYEGWARYAKQDMSAQPADITWDNASNNVTLHFGNVGGKSGAFSEADEFPGPVIYSGLSDYAQYNDKLSPESAGAAAFSADLSEINGNKVSVAYYDADASAWAYNKGSETDTTTWEYNGKSGGPDPSDNPLIANPSGTVYNFDEGVPICVIKGKGFPGQLNSGNCKADMVGTNGSAVSGSNQSIYEIASVTVVNTSNTVSEGEQLSAEVTIENTGTKDGEKYVALFDDNKNLVDYEKLNIDGGESPPASKTATLTWQTGTGDSPAGTDERTLILATADDNVTRDVYVQEADVDTPEFDVDIDQSSSSDTVEVDETVQVTATIDNVGDGDGSQYVTLTDHNGNLVDVTRVTNLGDSDPAQTVTLSYTPVAAGSGDVTVSTEDHSDTHSVTVTDSSSSGGVRYIGPASNSDALNYLLQQGYSGPGGNDTAGNSGNLKDTGYIDNGYVIEPKDDSTYDVYLADTDAGTWVEVVQGTDSHRYVKGSNVAGGDSGTMYDTLAADSNAIVCIADTGADINGTDPSTSDCGALYNKSGGLEYKKGENVLEVEGTQGNLSVLTTQIGERVEEREDVRQPLDVMFVLDESGSMGDYDFTDTAYPGNTYSPPENYFYVLETGEVYDSEDSFSVSTETEVDVYTGSDPLGFRIDATKSFVGSLNDTKDEAGAVQFDYDADVKQPLTDDLDDVNSSVAQDVGGSTYLGNAIDEGRTQLTAASNPDRQVMVVLSDGKADDDPVAAANRAADENITIYTVGLGDDVNEAELKQAANVTGGKYYAVDQADQLKQIFEQIATDAKQESIIQRSRTEVAAVNDAGKEWSVSLDGDSNLNDPTQYNTSSSTALEEQLSSGLNNSDLSFEVTVYGCNNYSAIDGVTSTVGGETYTHATCTEYDTTDSTTINNSNVHDHVIITANNSNYLSNISATGDWQPDPEDVASVDKDDLGEGEALIGLEVAHENQTGYVLMHFEVPTNETVRDNWDGDVGDGDTPDETEFTVSTDSVSPDPVTRGDTVTVDATVTNTGDTGTEAIVLKNDDGIVVDSTTRNLSNGETDLSVTLTWDTTGARTGDNSLTVAVENDSAAETVTVEADDPFFEVDSVSGETVTEGETMEVSGTITNTGQDDGRAQVVLEVKDGGEWYTVDAMETSATLTAGDPGQSETVTLSWETTIGDAGNPRQVRLQTAHDADTASPTVDPADTGGSNLGTSVGDPSSEPINIDVSRIEIE